MSLALLAASLLAGTPAGAYQATPSASSVRTSTASRIAASPSDSAPNPDPGSTSTPTPAAPAVVGGEVEIPLAVGVRSGAAAVLGVA